MLPLGEQTNPGQMRLALVQVVNWGTFHGAHTMHVDRNGTLLTGNSGVGKSTLFDAMLRVFDARPRSNEAAAQRSGGAVEDKRTTFTYMRGKVGDKAVGDSSASAFQRPGATWSAVALTFDNAAGTKVTISALFDLPKNGTESSVGRFYVIDSKPLDLEAIEGIAQKRFTKGALESIFPEGRSSTSIRLLPSGSAGFWASIRTRRCPCSASSRQARAWAAASTPSSATKCSTLLRRLPPRTMWLRNSAT